MAFAGAGELIWIHSGPLPFKRHLWVGTEFHEILRHKNKKDFARLLSNAWFLGRPSEDLAIIPKSPYLMVGFMNVVSRSLA